MISRRVFLKEASFAAAAVGLTHPVLNWAADQDGVPALPGKEGMIVRSFRFLDVEMPTEFMNSWITPVQQFTKGDRV
jgi:hypothetical protein